MFDLSLAGHKWKKKQPFSIPFLEVYDVFALSNFQNNHSYCYFYNFTYIGAQRIPWALLFVNWKVYCIMLETILNCINYKVKQYTISWNQIKHYIILFWKENVFQKNNTWMNLGKYILKGFKYFRFDTQRTMLKLYLVW